MRRDRQGIKSALVNRRVDEKQKKQQQRNESFYADQVLENFREKTPNIVEVDEFLRDNKFDHQVVAEGLIDRVNPSSENRKKYNRLKNSGSLFATLVLIVLLISALAQGVDAREEGGQVVDLDQLSRKIDAINVKVLAPEHLHGLSTSDPRAKEFVDRKTKVTSGLKTLLKDIAKSSTANANVIQSCVENTNSFAVADLKQDRKFLWENEYIQKKSGGRSLYRGNVLEGKNAVVLVDRFDDVNSTRETLLHECLHVWQDSQGINYSPAQQRELDQCIVGLRELLDKVPSCFNGDDDSCDEVEKYSKNFRHQIVIDECADPSLKVGDAYHVGKLSNSKISWKKSLLINFDPIEGSEGLCLKYAFGLEDHRTGKRVLFSDEEKDLAQMAVVLNSIRNRSQTAKLYKSDRDSRKTDTELHANFFDRVPPAVLSDVCEPRLIERLKQDVTRKNGGRQDL